MYRRYDKIGCILLAASCGALAALVFPVWLIAGLLAICLIALCVFLLYG